MKQEAAWDIAALGELLVDFTGGEAGPGGNPVFEANPGGAPCNVLAMAARLGRRPAAKKQAPPEKIPVDKRPEQAYIDKSALTDDQVDILLALEDRSLLAEDLIEATRLPAKRVLTALTLLQVQGYVAEHPGKRFQALARLRMD